MSRQHSMPPEDMLKILTSSQERAEEALGLIDANSRDHSDDVVLPLIASVAAQGMVLTSLVYRLMEELA